MNRRGQVVAPDLLITVVILLAIITILWIVKQNIQSNAAREEALEDLKVESYIFANQVLRTLGHPENWEEFALSGQPEKIETVGLVDEPGYISSKKIQGLYGLDYNTTKSLLKLGGYDFQMQVRYMNQSISGPNIYGPSCSKCYKATSTRFVIIRDYANGEVVGEYPSEIDITVWIPEERLIP